ncbi:MAG: RNA 2',3'-cyclic phosphodiesterase [Acidobacteriota bacterium]|nr:RNA 2',3'-cyclic phosphodiesterase [Acidobacteriota bacterium]
MELLKQRETAVLLRDTKARRKNETRNDIVDVGQIASVPRWRVFCAIDLPEQARERIINHAARLRAVGQAAQASWSREENMHLTLKFLGGIQTSRLSNLSNAATRAVADFSPFKITVEETGMFPKHGAPRVLWIGVKDNSGKLSELHNCLEHACAREGFAREERPFHPHLTIARLRKPQGARTLAVAHREMRFEPVAVAVAELLVIRSEPGGAGSRYSVISTHRLEA